VRGGGVSESCCLAAWEHGQTAPQTMQNPPPLACAKRAEFEVP
jgi:hypothetical protein